MPDFILDSLILKLPPKCRPILPLFSSICLVFACGYCNTFGNCLPYIVAYMKQKNTSIENQYMLFVSICQGGPPFSFLIGGYLDTFLGPRIAGAVGCVFLSGGVAMTYFTINVSFVALLFTFGVSFGIGFGIFLSIATSVSLKWLPKHRGIASGISITGAGLAGVIMNPLQSYYIGFVQHHGKKALTPEVMERIQKMFLYHGLGLAAIVSLALIFLSLPPESEEENGKLGTSISVPLKDVLRSSTFYWLLITCFGAYLIEVPRAYYKIFGEHFIKNDNFHSIVASAALGAGAVVRLLVGVLANKFGYQLVMCAIAAVMAVTMTTFQFTATLGQTAYLIWVVVILCAFGATFVLFPYITAVFFGTKTVGVNLSFIFLAKFVVGIGVTCATLVFGKLTMQELKILWYVTAVGWVVAFFFTLTIHKTKHGPNLDKRLIRRRLSIYDVEKECVGFTDFDPRVQRRNSQLPTASMANVTLAEIKPKRRNTVAPVVRFKDEVTDI